MGLVKSHGNMYPWVTHMHTHLRGECPHRCAYCYVKSFKQRGGVLSRYSGPLWLDSKALAVKYGIHRTIFIEHCNDLFALAVPENWIREIVRHCLLYPENQYVFQTKNPARMWRFEDELPSGAYVGVTVETNRSVPGLTRAPQPPSRLTQLYMNDWTAAGFKLFITVEPVLEFDLMRFAEAIIRTKPFFVNIGADSKGHDLREPSMAEVLALASVLEGAGIEVREKRNLERLRKE